MVEKIKNEPTKSLTKTKHITVSNTVQSHSRTHSVTIGRIGWLEPRQLVWEPTLGPQTCICKNPTGLHSVMLITRDDTIITRNMAILHTLPVCAFVCPLHAFS